MPKIIDHYHHRQMLLEKSRLYFVKVGFKSGDMRGLFKALKISAGAFYHYFPDKLTFSNQLIHFISSRVSKSVDQFIQSGEQPGLERVFKWLAACETDLLSELLLLIDLYRSQKPQRGQIDRSAPIDEFLKHIHALMGSSEQGKEGAEVVARFLTTYLVGVLIVRMWAPQDIKLIDFKVFLEKFSTTLVGVP